MLRLQLEPLVPPLLLLTHVDVVHSIHAGHGGSVMTVTSFLGRRACGCGGLQIERGWQEQAGFTRSKEA